ncbi:2-C-methyl-D-erythritol 2,4-cyclodiphosphate synthase [Candidatus Sumerlaeota bacterium]|nr:2-C-methyl-D-erythritol 2,4-cyclodiphosphate synthase [Candidatus Sumerlaeota bacterium]
MQTDSSFRIGQGFDVHRFAEGRKLIIGGVRIEHPRGLDGHSDADVLGHAIGDALLGAAALGDLGKHFPDTDPKFKDADSMALLRHIERMLAEGGWGIVNVDATLIAEAPRFAPHVPAMRSNLAASLGVEVERVSLKATTSEKLGFTGRGEGIAAMAVALIGKR